MNQSIIVDRSLADQLTNQTIDQYKCAIILYLFNRYSAMSAVSMNAWKAML